ncbi:hypothetical protein HY406_00490 [Candidatus Giovannonibacteria bacterium]|nr:hypothetical protein [Candidatus Giovannonibacteria bacterium]
MRAKELHRINGNRRKIIGRLRRSAGLKVSEKRRKTELAQKKIVNHFMRLWNMHDTSESFVMPIMRYQASACNPELKAKLDARVRKKRAYLETEVNLTDMQIRIRSCIRDS